MNKTATIIIVLLIIGLGIYYFSSSKKTNAPGVSTPAVSQTSGDNQLKPSITSTPVDATVVSIKNFSFNPGTLVVKTGTTIVWTNNDSMAHTVTSDAGGAFDSGNLAPGQSFSHTFSDVGSFAYHCAIHPNMKAEIIVQN